MYFPSLFCSLFHVFVFPGESVDKLQAVPAEPVKYQQSCGATERKMPRRFLFSPQFLSGKHVRISEARLNKYTWHELYFPHTSSCFYLSFIYDHVSSSTPLCECEKCAPSTFRPEAAILGKLALIMVPLAAGCWRLALSVCSVWFGAHGAG